MIVYKNGFEIPSTGSYAFPLNNFSLIDFLVATWVKLTALDTWTTIGGKLVQTAAADNDYIVANTGDVDQRVNLDMTVGSSMWDATVVLSTNITATSGVALKVSPTRLSIIDQATGGEIAALENGETEDQMYSTTLNIVGYRHGQSVYFSVFDVDRQKMHILTTERARTPLTFSTYMALRGKSTFVAPVKDKWKVSGSPSSVPETVVLTFGGVTSTYTLNTGDPAEMSSFYSDVYSDFNQIGVDYTVTCTYVNPADHTEGLYFENKIAGDVLVYSVDTTLSLSHVALPVYGSPDAVFDNLQAETLHSRVDVTEAMLTLTTLRSRVQEEVQDGGVTTTSIDAYLNRAYTEIYMAEHWRERKFTADIILHEGIEEYGLPVAIGDLGSIRRYNGMLRYDGEKALEQIYTQGTTNGTPENVTMNGRTIKFSPTPSDDWEGSLLRCEYYAGLTRIATNGMIEPGGLSSATDYPNLHPALHECVAQLAAIKLMATLREDGIAPASKRSDYARAYAFAKDQALGKDLSPAQVRIYRR